MALTLGLISTALLIVAVASPKWVSQDSDNGRGPWDHMRHGTTHSNGVVTCGGSYCNKARAVQAFSIMAPIFAGLGSIGLLIGTLGAISSARTGKGEAVQGEAHNASMSPGSKAGNFTGSALFLLAGIFGLIAFAIWTEQWNDDVNSNGYDWDWGYGCEIAGWILALIVGALTLA
jgi:hypothetical protein